jgi:WS/DGAT/MGAT family acyltransferase
MKVHHCMIDGVSGVQLMGVLLDPSPTPPHFTAPVTHRPPPLPSAMHRLVSALSDRLATAVHQGMTAVSFAMRPRAALAELQATVDAVVHLGRQLLAGAPRTPLNGPLGLARGLAWHTVSLNQVKAAKDRLGGSVNDIVLAALSGALRRVLIDRGMMADRTELRAVVPVNIRGAHQHLKLGNQISLMVAPLPIGILDPVERLRQVRAATGMLKKGNEAAKTERLVTLLDLVPPNLHRMLSGIRGLAAPTNTICTNVPGPPISLYMQGVRVDRIVPFVPLVEPVGLAFAILSYADTLTIGLTADAALVPDLREILPHLDASFDELWAATGLPRLARGGAVLPERQRRRANSAGTTGGTVTAIPRGQSGRRTE